jgi:hypothetical protein
MAKLFVPNEPAKVQGAAFPYPSVWCGEEALDGAVQPWLSESLGSIYIRVESGNVSLRMKTAENGASADWVTATFS